MHRRSWIFFCILFTLFTLPFLSKASVVNRSLGNSVQQGLIGWWTFDGNDMINGTITDRSRQSNTGYLINISTSTFYTFGKIGQAFNFDGNNDKVSIVNNPSLYNFNNATSPNFTLSAWVYLPANGCGSSKCTFMSSDPSAGTGGWRFLIGSSLQPELFFRNTTDDLNGTNSTVTVGAWHHVVAVYTASSTVAFYVDGAAQGVKVLTTGAVPASTATFNIGSDANVNQFFPGLIDDVRIYNVALATSSVKALYNLGASKFSTSRSTNSSGLVGYWTFDGKDMVNGAVRDLSGNGNTGYLINISTSTFYTFGKNGQGIDLDGVNDVVNLGNASSLTDIETQGGGGMSVAFWIKPHSNATRDIITKGGANTNSGTWRITKSSATNPPRLSFTKEGVGDAASNRNSTLDLNVWQHIVITWNGSMTFSTGVHYYKNGVELTGLSFTDGSGANSDATRSLCIGNSSLIGSDGNCNTNSTTAGDESIDDVRIYNRVLSAAEVQQIYNQSGQGLGIGNVRTDRLTNGLVGLWTFNGKDMPSGRASDTSGNGNTGYVSGISTTTFYSFGKIGQGLNFDGVDDKINLGSEFIGTTAVTVTAWIKPTTINTTQRRIVTNGKFDFALDTSSSRLIFTSNATNARSAASSISTGVWQHVAVTRTSGGVTNFYVNGALSGTADQSSDTPVSGTTNVFIGNTSSGSTNVGFAGTLDDVRIYNRVLSTSEISQLYNLGK